MVFITLKDTAHPSTCQISSHKTIVFLKIVLVIIDLNQNFILSKWRIFEHGKFNNRFFVFEFGHGINVWHHVFIQLLNQIVFTTAFLLTQLVSFSSSVNFSNLPVTVFRTSTNQRLCNR